MKKYLFLLLVLFFISGCTTLNKSLPVCYWVGGDIPTEFDCTQESVKEEFNRLEESSTLGLQTNNFNVKYYAKIASYRTDGFILVYEDSSKIEKCICRDTFTSYSGGEHSIERGCEFVPDYLPGNEKFASCK